MDVDTRSYARADTLWDGSNNKLYVASADPNEASSSHHIQIRRYTCSNGTYTIDQGFPVSFSGPQGSQGTRAVTIAKDGTGRLWIAYTEDSTLYVSYSNYNNGADTSWAPRFTPSVPQATALTNDDIAAIVAFGGNKIGVMWSNQTVDPDTGKTSFYFAYHNDGASDSTWTGEVARSDVEEADGHINLKADSSGNVYAVVKTSRDVVSADPSEPVTKLLKRDTNGNWSLPYTVGTKSDNVTSPSSCSTSRTTRCGSSPPLPAAMAGL